MNRINKSLIAILITFGIGISAWLFYNSSYFETTKFEIPQSRWEKLYFKSIDKTTELAKLEKLREKNLSKNDIEIRIWEGFGLEDLEGVIFTRIDNIWRAYYVRSNDYVEPTKAYYISLYNVPKSGWESFTKEFFATGVLTLADADSVGCRMYNLDGKSYVVEIYKDKTYRTYMYANNAGEKCKQGKQMIKIANLISKEFHIGIQNCTKRDEWLSCNYEKKE